MFGGGSATTLPAFVFISSLSRKAISNWCVIRTLTTDFIHSRAFYFHEFICHMGVGEEMSMVLSLIQFVWNETCYSFDSSAMFNGLSVIYQRSKI